jgi:cell division protein FtsB
MYLFILALLLLLALHFWKRKEGYETYDEKSCLTLAKKNQNNLDSLKKDMDKILALQNKVETLSASNESNKTQLKNVTDHVYKTT